MVIFVWFFVTAVVKISLRDLTHLTFDHSIDLISIFPLTSSRKLASSLENPTNHGKVSRFVVKALRLFVDWGPNSSSWGCHQAYVIYVSELSQLIQQLQSNNQISQNKMATNWWKLLRHIWLLIPDIQIHIHHHVKKWGFLRCHEVRLRWSPTGRPWRQLFLVSPGLQPWVRRESMLSQLVVLNLEFWKKNIHNIKSYMQYYCHVCHLQLLRVIYIISYYCRRMSVSCLYISSYPPIFLEAPDKGGKNWGFLALESRFVGEYLEDHPS